MACLIRHKLCIAVGARPPKGFDVTKFCARLWQKGEVYLTGQRVRPNQPNGYEFEAGVNGQSNGKKEPWPAPPTIPAATYIDGSITWTRQPISNASLLKTISSGLTWLVDPPGLLLIESPSVIVTNGEQKTQAFFNANAAPPGTYVVTNEWTFSDGHEDFGIYEVEVEEP